MAKKQTTDDRRQKTGKAGPVAAIYCLFIKKFLDTLGNELLFVTRTCEQVKHITKDLSPKVAVADNAIELAAQLARGAENYVQGSHNPNASKWAFVSKPKLNELKKALRKVGVKI